eukprot:PhF_6_TR1417/c0_g1_i1/m.2477
MKSVLDLSRTIDSECPEFRRQLSTTVANDGYHTEMYHLPNDCGTHIISGATTADGVRGIEAEHIIGVSLRAFLSPNSFLEMEEFVIPERKPMVLVFVNTVEWNRCDGFVALIGTRRRQYPNIVGVATDGLFSSDILKNIAKTGVYVVQNLKQIDFEMFHEESSLHIHPLNVI